MAPTSFCSQRVFAQRKEKRKRVGERERTLYWTIAVQVYEKHVQRFLPFSSVTHTHKRSIYTLTGYLATWQMDSSAVSSLSLSLMATKNCTHFSPFFRPLVHIDSIIAKVCCTFWHGGGHLPTPFLDLELTQRSAVSLMFSYFAPSRTLS